MALTVATDVYDKFLQWSFPKEVGNFTLIGNSRAADTTAFYIPELDCYLDAGYKVTHKKPGYIFITHPHIDHAHALNILLSRRKNPTIFVPYETVKSVNNYIAHGLMMTCHEFDISTFTPSYELIPAKHNDIHTLDRQTGPKNMSVKIYEMEHSVPCIGFGFFEKRNKLKQEYRDLKSSEIAAIRKTGIDVSETIQKPLFCYLGDTTIIIFERYRELFDFPVIICECTFIDDKEKVLEGDNKHIVWSQLKPYILKYPEITFVLIHFSQSYKNYEIIDFFNKENIKNILPWIN
jgi:ribonuclease Z